MNKKPNIILFLTDDLGYGDLSCLNTSSQIHTENIDFMASQGMRFTDAHSTSAVCSPSRYGILTGRYNWRSALKNLVLPGCSKALIEDGRKTVASMLKENGYNTACVGKWHLGMDWETIDGRELNYNIRDSVNRGEDLGLDYTKPIKNGPNAKGFDYFFGMPASLDQAPYVYIENDKALGIPSHIIGTDACDHSSPGTELMYDLGPAMDGFDVHEAIPKCDSKVLELVDKFAAEEKPFFIYYPSLAVHGPLVPTEEFIGKSGIGIYGDFVLMVDDFIGKLNKRLESLGIADNTIVIFTSDNGCSSIVDFKKLAEYGHNPNHIFRGSKSDIWEGGHRIPLIVKWPNQIAENSICEQTVCLVDLFATFAEIIGYSIPDNAAEDSVSNLGLWKGDDGMLREATVHHSFFGYYAIRKGDWKLEMCPGSGGGTKPSGPPDTDGLPPMQLYNLKDDIGELNNLIDKHPEVASELQAVLTDYIKSGRSTPGEPQKNYPSENWPGLEWLLN